MLTLRKSLNGTLQVYGDSAKNEDLNEKRKPTTMFDRDHCSVPAAITPQQEGQTSWEVKCTRRGYTVALDPHAFLPVGWNRDLHRDIQRLAGPGQPLTIHGSDLVSIEFVDDSAATLGLVVDKIPLRGFQLRPISIGHIRLQYDPQLGPLFRLAAQCSRTDREVHFGHPVWEAYWHPLIRLAAERDSTFDHAIRRDLQEQIDDRCAALLIEARRAGVMSADRQIQDWLEQPQQAMLTFEQFRQKTAEWEQAHRGHFTCHDDRYSSVADRPVHSIEQGEQER